MGKTFVHPDVRRKLLSVGPGLHIRLIVLKNVINYKYKTSTLTPFVKPCNVLYIQLYVESTFKYNLGSTPNTMQDGFT